MKKYPKIGIRPTIDGRQGGVRESLEEKTMNLAKAVAELISSNLKSCRMCYCRQYYRTCSRKRCLRREIRKRRRWVHYHCYLLLVLWCGDNGYESSLPESCLGLQRNRASGSSISCSSIGRTRTKRTSCIRHLWT